MKVFKAKKAITWKSEKTNRFDSAFLKERFQNELQNIAERLIKSDGPLFSFQTVVFFAIGCRLVTREPGLHSFCDHNKKAIGDANRMSRHFLFLAKQLQEIPKIS